MRFPSTLFPNKWIVCCGTYNKSLTQIACMTGILMAAFGCKWLEHNLSLLVCLVSVRAITHQTIARATWELSSRERPNPHKLLPLRAPSTNWIWWSLLRPLNGAWIRNLGWEDFLIPRLNHCWVDFDKRSRVPSFFLWNTRLSMSFIRIRSFPTVEPT